MSWRLFQFPILASTNDLALQWIACRQAAPWDVLVADEQTAGRGRRGRRWVSPKGALLMTAVLPFAPDRVGWSALAAGVAVARALRQLGAPAGVKWPNDVLLGGRKVAGVLAETGARDLLAVGVGVNVRNPLPSDPEVAARSARVADTLPEITVEQVRDAVLRELQRTWSVLVSSDPSPLFREWELFDTTTGREVRFPDLDLRGVAEGVEESGALRIRCIDGSVYAAVAGEVVFV